MSGEGHNLFTPEGTYLSLLTAETDRNSHYASHINTLLAFLLSSGCGQIIKRRDFRLYFGYYDVIMKFAEISLNVIMIVIKSRTLLYIIYHQD